MSDPRGVWHLLGGYAAGTLTEAERRALFAAALEDQALFDALGDEEALRELLADPAARAELLAGLRPGRPFWRRPGAMALAASLVAAVGVGILFRQGRAERMAQEALPQGPAATPQIPAKPSSPTPAAGEAPRRDSPRLEKQAAPRSQEMAPAPAPVPPPPPPPPEVAASAAPAPASAEAASGAVAESVRPPAAEARRITSTANLAPGVLAKAAPARVQPPEWAFTAPDRLRITWGPGGTVYLLRRDAQGTRVLEPASERALPGGGIERVFKVSSDGSTLDLYWLPEPAARPDQLPPQAPSGGTWIRIR